ncbi:hypothetical protein BUALT_Bualt03G0050400 [Buddleja alternifolia]|uniref:Uncharacterized protein n=1 Tax=Buddleja alternifolia TaxID=168488 RepID=A0AAV6XXZ2_9LAMI|nr:hypothetical protein BUALT_Bualt03G0050400 [Buddleja alternifolia]
MFCMKTMSAIITAVFFMTSMSVGYAQATDYNTLRLMASKHNMTCILVFGDSSTDPGNNNKLSTSMKSNFLPYGEDFFNGRPSGRFSNGRLATDFIAEAFGYTNLIKAFLDPAITRNDLLHGVSFASAASGYDEYTANLSNVLSISKQLDYFRHYKIRLRNLVGRKESEEIIENAIFVLSMGSNDLLVNYYGKPTRSKQYNLEQYQNYLISCMQTAIKKMHSLGARKLVVVGVPPFGCLPIVRTLKHDVLCDVELNKVAFMFNLKIQRGLKTLNEPSFRSIYADIYDITLNVVEHPLKYGFIEPLKGCCGSGTYEYGVTCKNLTTCADRTKYVFWDAFHFTEKMYKIIADAALGIILSFMF